LGLDLSFFFGLELELCLLLLLSLLALCCGSGLELCRPRFERGLLLGLLCGDRGSFFLRDAGSFSFSLEDRLCLFQLCSCRVDNCRRSFSIAAKSGYILG
jgi:hypothetical protein